MYVHWSHSTPCVILLIQNIRGVARGGGHGRMSPPRQQKRKKFVMKKKLKVRIDPPPVRNEHEKIEMQATRVKAKGAIAQYCN